MWGTRLNFFSDFRFGLGLEHAEAAPRLILEEMPDVEAGNPLSLGHVAGIFLGVVVQGADVLGEQFKGEIGEDTDGEDTDGEDFHGISFEGVSVGDSGETSD